MNSLRSELSKPAAALVRVENLEKTFFSNHKRTEVLKPLDFEVARGETVGVIGPSGAGKSTLLHILGTLDKPSAGHVYYNEEDVFSWNEEKLAQFRNRKLGFIFQFHHLLPEFNALENTMMPALVAGLDRRSAEQRAREILSRIGLGHRLTHKPGELSGGEQQRIAVARALIMKPDVVLADEPTGNLDSHTGEEVFNLLLELNREMQMTFVMVTHNETLAKKIPRCITLVDGRVVEKWSRAE